MRSKVRGFYGTFTRCVTFWKGLKSSEYHNDFWIENWHKSDDELTVISDIIAEFLQACQSGIGSWVSEIMRKRCCVSPWRQTTRRWQILERRRGSARIPWSSRRTPVLRCRFVRGDRLEWSPWSWWQPFSSLFAGYTDFYGKEFGNRLNVGSWWGPWTMDWKTEKNVDELTRRPWCHEIGLDFLCQKTPIITPQETNRSARIWFEDIAFNPWF
jgi:hypothetical protein